VTLVVRHFGPDPGTVGGMASVIRVFAEHNVGADMVSVSPTWKPAAPLATARLVGAATRTLLQMPPLQVAHVHLSERGSFLREGSLLVLARRHGLVTVATLHGASFVPFALSHPRLVSLVSRRAHLITCLEQETLDAVRRCAPEVRSEIVANPVAVEESFIPADQTDELVLFAGEIGLRKGADVLYRAWQTVARRRPQAHCLMVGPSTDFAPPGTERLEVRASVKPREMREILRGARVVALPSRAEGMPMILTEAMSLGARCPRARARGAGSSCRWMMRAAWLIASRICWPSPISRERSANAVAVSAWRPGVSRSWINAFESCMQSQVRSRSTRHIREDRCSSQAFRERVPDESSSGRSGRAHPPRDPAASEHDVWRRAGLVDPRPHWAAAGCAARMRGSHREETAARRSILCLRRAEMGWIVDADWRAARPHVHEGRVWAMPG
jgi:glycosyltransferase involved in cell wall biosynthesis